MRLRADGTAADAVLLMGRVKVHTDFKSPIGIESGLMKMAAIGMGKHKQALLIHSYGVHGIRDIMPEVAKVVLKEVNILCGVAIVENAFEQTAIMEAIPTEKIPVRESELLKVSASLMPKLPVDGIGLADLTTRRLFEKIDFQIMNENVGTSTFLHRAMISIGNALCLRSAAAGSAAIAACGNHRGAGGHGV